MRSQTLPEYKTSFVATTTRLEVKEAVDGRNLCSHLAIAILIRMFHCFNIYQRKETITCQLFKAIQYVRGTFTDRIDVASVTTSLISEYLAKDSRTSKK